MQAESDQEPENPDLTALRASFFLNYGRLLWRYQQIEAMAKQLGTHIDTKITVSLSGGVIDNGKAESERGSMGQIRESLTGKLFATDEAESDQPIGDEASARFVFRPYVGIDPEERRRFEAEYAALVGHRNEAVHHFVDRMVLTDRSSMEAGIVLIMQRLESALPMHQRLADLLRKMLDARALMSSALCDPEIIEVIDSPSAPRISNISTVLEKAARESRRPGNWVLLSEAGQGLRREAAVEMDSFKTITGHRTLKQFLKASPQFEVGVDVLPSGETRPVYRLAKPTGPPRH